MKVVICSRKIHPEKLVFCDIDRCYTLFNAVEVMNFLKQGHARGKVVINIESK